MLIYKLKDAPMAKGGFLQPLYDLDNMGIFGELSGPMFYSKVHGFLAFRAGSIIYFLKFGETEENAATEYQKGIVFVSPEKKRNRNTQSP